MVGANEGFGNPQPIDQGQCVQCNPGLAAVPSQGKAVGREENLADSERVVALSKRNTRAACL